MGKELLSCRVCLRKTKKTTALSNVFDITQATELRYSNILSACTGLSEADATDEMPQQLCTTCAADLVVAHNFRQLALRSEQELRLLNKSSCRRQTRSSLQNKQNNETELSTDTEESATAKTVKVELTTFVRDPLEETDDEESQDDRQWQALKTAAVCSDHESADKNATDDDDDDDKPLNELFKNVKELPANVDSDTNAEHCFNTFEDDNEEGTGEDINDLAITPEAQIFPQGRYKCKICAKTYFTAVGLKAHGAVHLPKSSKSKKKPRGPNKKAAKSATISHENAFNTDDKDAVSDEQVVDENAKLQKQEITPKERKIKLPKPKKMFPCQVCGKHMISASKLRYHMVMHTGEKDYLCTICPKAYSTIYALKHHMRTHTGERPYECKFCGDKFTRPTTLKSHMRRHTGERPYGCDICGKRFIQHSSMTTHMKLNHMAKTIPCPHCDKKYARQTDLTTHLLSHTGDKPFSCQLCPSRFIRQANLNKHMNQHHTSKVTMSNNQRGTKQKNTKAEQKSSFTKDAAAAALLQEDEDHAKENNIETVINAQITSISALPIGLDRSRTTAVPQLQFATSNNLTPDLFASNAISGGDTHSRESVDHLVTITKTPIDAHHTENLQHIFGQTTMIDSQRLGSAIDDINRWSWSNSSQL